MARCQIVNRRGIRRRECLPPPTAPRPNQVRVRQICCNRRVCPAGIPRCPTVQAQPAPQTPISTPTPATVTAPTAATSLTPVPGTVDPYANDPYVQQYRAEMGYILGRQAAVAGAAQARANLEATLIRQEAGIPDTPPPPPPLRELPPEPGWRGEWAPCYRKKGCPPKLTPGRQNYYAWQAWASSVCKGSQQCFNNLYNTKRTGGNIAPLLEPLRQP
jgi:hypothetical protein